MLHFYEENIRKIIENPYRKYIYELYDEEYENYSKFFTIRYGVSYYEVQFSRIGNIHR